MLRAERNRTWRYIALFAIVSALPLSGQGPQPRFEAASIRHGDDIISTKPQLTPGRLLWTTDLAHVIAYAYGVESNNISAKDSKVAYSNYTITAVFDPNAADDDVRRMLQSFLGERFKLQVHRQVKQVEGFAVSLAKGGLKMKPSATKHKPEQVDSGSSKSSVPADESYVFGEMQQPGITKVTGHEASLTQLVACLQRLLQRPFWDQTGLQGKYDFAFTFAEDPNADPQTDVPALSTAMRESLGLTLHKQLGPLETLVIDSIESPSNN